MGYYQNLLINNLLYFYYNIQFLELDVNELVLLNILYLYKYIIIE